MEDTRSMYPLLSLKAPLLDTAWLLLVFFTYSLGIVDWLVAHEPYLKVGIELLTLIGLIWRGGVVLKRHLRRRKDLQQLNQSSPQQSPSLESGEKNGNNKTLD